MGEKEGDDESIGESEEERMCKPPSGFDTNGEVRSDSDQASDSEEEQADSENEIEDDMDVKMPARADKTARKQGDLTSRVPRAIGIVATALPSVIKSEPIQNCASRRATSTTNCATAGAAQTSHADGKMAKDWIRFHAGVSENDLPKKFKDVLHLMDTLFPGNSYHNKLWVDATRVNYVGVNQHGYYTRGKLRNLKDGGHSGVMWHQIGMDWAPKTKEHLESFIRVLMEMAS